MPLEYDDITPTEEQAAILDAFEGGKHLAVTALAGTGKTSTLRMCGETIRRKRGVYLAFNRAIADEASSSFPGRVECRTAHSFAFRAIGKNYAGRLNGKRMPPWDVAKVLDIEALQLEDRTINPTRLASLTREMVARFCYTSDPEITMRHVPFVRGMEARYDPATDTSYPDLHPILAKHLIDYARDMWADLQKIDGRFRFDHDHYLKIWALTHPQLPGDFILVDEAQDLNGVLIGLVEDQAHMQRVIVGDKQQQIYAWRGSVNAMEMFDVDAELPLTQSWRFGPEIAAAANVFLEELGSDLRISGNPDKVSQIAPVLVPDAVLCRTNAGGLDALIAAQRAGKRSHFAGGRAAEMRSFCEAVAKMQAGQIVQHPDLQAFATWQEVVDYTKTTSDPDFTSMVKLIQRYGVPILIGALEGCVPASRAEITVSTGHSSKGLEWGQVRIGSDFDARGGDDEEARVVSGEEIRLRYVSVTRAKDVLDPGPLAEDLGIDLEVTDDQ